MLPEQKATLTNPDKKTIAQMFLQIILQRITNDRQAQSQVIYPALTLLVHPQFQTLKNRNKHVKLTGLVTVVFKILQTNY